MEKNMGQLWLKRNAIWLLGAASLGLTTSCGVDLGKCDMTQLGGSTTSVNYGQTVVQTSCSGGRCHSATATGKARTGAPAGLNFDVVLTDNSAEAMNRVAKGTKEVHDEAKEMWSLVDGGDMPPPGEGGPLAAADKEKLRNWLACGAQVLTPGVAATTADWSSIYSSLQTTCLACHSTATSTIGQGFSLGDDMCSAYKAVVNQKSVTTTCKASAMTLVVPGQPSMSFMLQKLKGTQTCGSYMPAGAPMPYAATNAAVVTQLEQWITAGATKPATCP